MTASSHATRFISTLGIAAFITIGACGGKDKAADTTSAATATPVPSSPAPAAAAMLTVADIDVGKHVGADKKITDKTDSFGPKDTIYASVHTTGSASNSAMIGRWTFQNGSTVDEHTETISPTGDAYTEFHIAKPSGWPKGKYTLHVLVDGKETQTKDVTVK